MTKKWYQSKTVLANIGLMIVGIQQNLQFIEGIISPAVFGWALFFLGVGGVILRLVTDSGIEK